MSTIDVVAWLDRYREAWEARDPEAAAALFTEDASYAEQPYEDSFQGADGVRDYWAKVTSSQDSVELIYGAPLIVGDRAAVEWWVNLTNGGVPVTLAGSFMLQFAPDGRCHTLREYWHFVEGRHQPKPGWGTS